MDSEEIVSLKHKNSDSESDSPPKKQKLFSAKEFRKQLLTGDKITSVVNFLKAVKEDKHHDYIYDYLEAGGNCLELLQLLEQESTLNPCIVFELVTYVLLKINIRYPQHHSSAIEACKYMISTYVSLINKMINLSSTTIERRTALKLLTAIVTLSLNLAKDILINVNFNQTNLELLTKHTGQKDSVRDIFIHFLTAFLVDGHYPSLSILLEKRGILTSIIKDLQYDNCETVCLVITAMKNHILENPSVSKTAKMKTFSTPVVRDIVNLYNWKGPASFKSQKKDVKVKIDINEIEKSKVSACVHEFLLVLCTSHKHGVIFRDPSMGLGKKHQNSLMYTVLESLDRPWEHSYASQLVTKICKACPDLVKTMWANLKPYLELRPTKKWLNAVNFAKSLVRELDASCIEFCAKDLGVGQLGQIVSFLVLPVPILKVVVSEGFVYEDGVVRQHVVGLLVEFLRSTLKFSGFALKKFLDGHVGRNFPDAYSVLKQWGAVEDCGEISCLTPGEELEAIFDLFEGYKKISPRLLETLNNGGLNIHEFLLGLQDEKLQLKALNLFVDLDSVKFSPKTELFEFSVSLALRFYYQNRDQHSLRVLQKLFLLTNIFDGCEAEVNFWINAILDLKKFDGGIAEVLVKVLRETSENLRTYVDDLNGLKKAEDLGLNYKEVIQSLTDDRVDVKSGIKHKNLSPFVIGLLDSVKEGVGENLTVYLTFAIVTLYHSQTNANVLREVLRRFKLLPDVLNYIEGDSLETFPDFRTFKVFDRFRRDFLTGNVGDFDCVYPDLPLNLLQLAVFYVGKLCLRNELTDQHIDNFANLLKSVKVLDGATILGNFNIYSQFSWGSPLIKLVCVAVKVLEDNKVDIEQYLAAYRKKLVTSLSKIVRKPQKYQTIEGLRETLETIKLEREHCTDLLTKITNDDSGTIIEIVAYCLSHLADFDDINLDLTKLGDYFEFLLQNEKEFDKISNSLSILLEKFPYLIQDLRPDFFNNLLSIQDYHKNNVQLCKFLLERNLDYLQTVKENLDKICQKKFLILPLLKIITDNFNDLELTNLWEKFEPTLTKALQKPQKAGQHFINNPQGLYKLIKVAENPKFFDKVQKFDVSEIFLAVIIRGFGEKLLNNKPTEKQTSNLILTFIHLELTIVKRKNLEKLEEIAENFNAILDLIDCDLPTIPANDSFKLFCKFSLKYGVSSHPILLRTLGKLIKILSKNLDLTDVKILFDMLTSHSEFLNVILDDSPVKLEILTLFSKMVDQWPALMERAHIPVLLAAYRATLRKSDTVILGLLRKYEQNSSQTQFHDFKPFLWDRAAVNHYSVRSTVENRLSRQPKMGDVLDILQEQHVRSTIKNYSIHQSLREPNVNVDNETCYDLSFLLPLFSQLLAPENQVYTYNFARSGALSLTIVALSSSDEEVRKAACHVLSRYYFHMEARQTGKDNLLWVRFIEAVSKGTALLEGFRLNNFSAIYLSRMALILTQPTHVMYVPMSQYLAAKPSLDFSTVPELYTFLHSSDVNYREHRQFALELLRDGLRTEKDFTDFLRSMAFKLFSCLYNSTLADLDTKTQILDILISCCKIPLGCKILCENHSFLPQLKTMLVNDRELTPKFLTAINWLTQTINDKFFTKEIYNMLTLILDQSESTLHTILLRIYKKYPQFFDDDIFQKLEEKSGDKLCKYIMKYGCRFLNMNAIEESDLRLLFFTRFK